MYATKNYPTKKAFKADVADGNVVTFYQPNDMVGIDTASMTGRVFIEGPHYPKAHSWYADCDAINGRIVKVR